MDINQHVFTFVLEHLRKQGEPSMRYGSYALRGAGGRKCSIGAIISFHAYDETLDDGCMITKEIRGLIAPEYRGEMELLQQLQRLHDNGGHWDRGFNTAGEEAARQIAEEHGLQYTAPCAK